MSEGLTNKERVILGEKLLYPYNKRNAKCHICKAHVYSDCGILHIRPTSPSYRAIWDVVCRNEKCNYEYMKKYDKDWSENFEE